MISARALEKYFPPVRALGPVDFDIPAGSQVALLGESGSGKSTLLNLLGCMEVPSSGDLEMQGKLTRGLSEKELAEMRLRKIGYVHQFFDLISDLNALENVMLPMWMAGDAESETRATDLLKSLGLGHRLTQTASLLSGGEQQRVAIARALSLSPSLILADEPSGSLDSSTGEAVVTLLLELTKKAGSTLIMATHSPAAAARFEHFIRLKDGKIVEKNLPKVKE
ncbi:MAG: ABC transporter ATP-binding protein [Methylotenera sp.]|nr:ABC transporter ATP-binding protein [Oligoflexia bacterium]